MKRAAQEFKYLEHFCAHLLLKETFNMLGGGSWERTLRPSWMILVSGSGSSVVRNSAF